MINRHFAGIVIGFGQGGEGEQVFEETLAIEVVDKKPVEIAFNYKGERVYVKFNVEELLAAIKEYKV
jgi:hypothetical protein